jgi:hypothetical protein
VTKTQSTITLGQILAADGLPEGVTAVAWSDTQVVESRYQIEDSSWMNTTRGQDYDPNVTGHLIYNEIVDGAVAWKFADPTEDARWLTYEDSIGAIRAEDPSLVAVFADYDDSAEQ